MRETTSTEDAYLAGFIDGEGTIRSYAGRGAGRYVSVCNTSRDVIDWITERYGPTNAREDQPRTDARGIIRRKVIWKLSWTSKASITALLDRIGPYLVVKAADAEAIRLEISTSPGRGSPGRPRKTHCVNGHPRVPENLTKNRSCRICMKDHMRRYYQQRKAAEDEQPGSPSEAAP